MRVGVGGAGQGELRRVRARNSEENRREPRSSGFGAGGLEDRAQTFDLEVL